MTQEQLDREVARALGEEVREIQRRGFSIADPDVVNFDPEPFEPIDALDKYLDWDEVDAKRHLPAIPQFAIRRAA